MVTNPEKQFTELRKKAEKLIQQNNGLRDDQLNTDLNKIIQELQIHQVELEMQNDELRATQNELEESTQRYYKMFNQAPVGYASVDTLGIIRHANQALSDMLGVEPMVLKKRPISQFILEKDNRIFLSRFKQTHYKVKSNSFEIRMLNKSGSLIHTRLSVQASDSSDILIVIFDITEQKKADKKLKENKRLLNSIVEDIPAMICRFDKNGRISYVNQEFSDFFCKNENFIIGKNYFSVLPMAHQNYVKEQFSQLNPKKTVKSYDIEVNSISKGKVFQQWVIRAIYKETGDILFYQTIGYDITEQKRIHDEKKEKEKLSGIVELAGALCHELRQPLQILLGVSDLIVIKNQDNIALRKELNLLTRQVDRINLSLNQLDSITRYETKSYLGTSKILDLNNTSDRRKNKRYIPGDPVFMKITGDESIEVKLIDIGKGGFSFSSVELNISELENFFCDIFNNTGKTLIKCLPCILISGKNRKNDSLYAAETIKYKRAKFVDLTTGQIEQIQSFIETIQNG